MKREAVIVLVIAAGAAMGGWLLTHRGVSPGVNATAEGKGRVLYWYDPMRPEQHFAKPGKSPFMDMQLVPMTADEAGGHQVLESVLGWHRTQRGQARLSARLRLNG